MKTVCLEGRIFSGKGEGAKFIRLPWVKNQILEQLGFIPYPGTMDVRINEESVKLKRSLTGEPSIEILPVSDFCRGKCYLASFKTETKCAVVVPEIIGYPEDVIEIIGRENLRKKFHLSDGDHVQVRVRF